MSETGRPRPNRERWASDHERARQRAAERLSLPLPAAENGWLDRHLRSCASCTSSAAEYAAQQTSLRALEEPIPPRDLWARTAAALDRAERRTGRDLPNTSVFPGRGGLPGSRGSRSIRGLRAEQRASAFRAGPRSVPARLLADRRGTPRPSGIGWVAPFGALAALAIVIVVGGNALLTGPPITPIRSAIPADSATAAAPAGSGTPAATPIQVGAGEVAWLTPADDGTYSLIFASVDQVCPANAQPDCAPIAGSSPRHLPTVGSSLHTVIRSPSHKQLVVVPTSTKRRSGGGGSVIVVAVPTPVPTATPATSAPPATDSPPSSVVVTPTPSPTPSPSAVETASPTVGASPSDTSSPTPVASGSGGSAAPSPAETASPSGTASPTESVAAPAVSPSALETASVGIETATPTLPASPSASGSPSSPASQSAPPSEPTPSAVALAIINDIVVVGETASYSPDGTMLAFSARPADRSQGPDIYLWRPGDLAAHPVTSDHASVFSGWLNNQLLGSRAVDGAGRPASSRAPGLSGPTQSASGEPVAAPGTSGESPSAGASDGAGSDNGASGDPVASPTGTDASNAEGAVSVNFVADVPAVPQDALSRSFVLDPVTGIETDLIAPAWRPVVDSTGRFVAYWAGTLRYDVGSLTWIPDRGALVLASWPALRGTDPGATLTPVPLLDNGAASVPAGEWDIRWDESGTHIAIWAADADNPELGRLTLLTIDASGRVDPAGISLRDAPALAGFSIGTDRLAWATPPGQDGEGSRLQVLAWSGANAGKIDSQPASAGDAVVVVR